MKGTTSMFKSLLLKDPDKQDVLDDEIYPKIWEDLHLEQIISYISKKIENKNIVKYFYKPLKDLEEIHYRHEIFKDLEENKSLFEVFKNFVEEMDVVKKELAFSNKLEYKYNKEGWWLEALDKYINTIKKVEGYLYNESLKSQGLINFSNYIKEYANNTYFNNLIENFKIVKENIEKVSYCLNIDGLKVTVYKCEKDEEYKEDILKTFEKFKNQLNKEYNVKITIRKGMDHVENEIIDRVSKIYPYPFELLDSFYKEYYNFLDPIIGRCSEELKFYLAYIDFIENFKNNGLNFCYPLITLNKGNIYLYESFDLALAYEKLKKGDIVVVNDLELSPQERIIIVTGPNQGGKTTFARMVGEVFYLSRLGVPVPGKEVRIFFMGQYIYSL